MSYSIYKDLSSLFNNKRSVVTKTELRDAVSRYALILRNAQSEESGSVLEPERIEIFNDEVLMLEVAEMVA